MVLKLVLGNQLFDPVFWPQGLRPDIIFIREDRDLCTYFPFHTHKIVLFLAAMRTYADHLRSLGYRVIYDQLDMQSNCSYMNRLTDVIRQHGITELTHFEIEDHFFEAQLTQRLPNISTTVIDSPMFLTTRRQFNDYLKTTKKPFMKSFYEQQRRRLGILVTPDSLPVGGQWSFDADNRKPMPKTIVPPPIPTPEKSKVVQDVIELVKTTFPTHIGNPDMFWLPVSRQASLAWLDQFVLDRFNQFGPYEDAMPSHSTFGFHSVLTPMLNLGIITPQDIINRIQLADVPIQSKEGFIRQIIGWREFIRGIYHQYDHVQQARNFFGHHRKLAPCFWAGETGIPLLDRVIKTVIQYGYCHHIERLMVLSNMMTLLEIDPHEAHGWFMTLFVDSSDWVMGPNVYGMGLFSDGGIFATKPYICGSSYWRKMSQLPAGPWCDGVDGLYWQFIENHRDFFLSNPRLSMMVRQLDKLSESRKSTIFSAANQLRDRLTR
ncbi:cryptochrome/photolyase family protein [bacterium]|nr:cryptochrome/photolyase family protein [bacterium]